MNLEEKKLRAFAGLIGLTVLAIPFLVHRFPSPALAGEPTEIRLLGDRADADGLPEGWRPLSFPKVHGHTRYTLIQEEGRPVILAQSRQSASALYHPLDLDPKAYPLLSWCWKVDRVISNGDESRKKGDDYAARVYVTFRFDPARASLWDRLKFSAIKLVYGEYPPMAAINYIWANRLPKGETVVNAYTDRARMVAVESGKERVGDWACEKRNIYDDYRWLFGEEPSQVSGVAVMTDTDDTHEEASAYYADLALRPPSSGTD